MQYGLPVAQQIEAIRNAIERDSESYVSCENLRILCDDEADPAQQFKSVAAIANWENWTFKFLSDGRVRFRRAL